MRAAPPKRSSTCRSRTTSRSVVSYYEHDGGYIDNTYKERTFQLDDGDPTTKTTVNNAKYVGKNQNDVDTYGGRATLKIDLDSDWSVTPQLIYQKQISHGSFLFDPNAGDLTVHDFIGQVNRDEFVQAAGTIQGKISNWDFTYSAGYMDRHKHQTLDYSYYSVAYDHYSISAGTASKGKYFYYTNFPMVTVVTSTRISSNTSTCITRSRRTEVHLASPSTGPVKVTIGAFYQRQTDQIATDFTVAGVSESGVATPNPNIQPLDGFPDVIFLKRLYRVDRDTALFGEGSWDITPKLTLTAGIRGFHVNNSLYGFSGIGATGRSVVRQDQ
jgi:hypothetical protein